VGTLSDFDLDDEMGLLPWSVAFMDVGVRVRQFLDRDGRAGAKRLRAFLEGEAVPAPAEPEQEESATQPPPVAPSREVSYPPTSLPFGPVHLTRDEFAQLKAGLARYEGLYRLFEMAAERSPEWVWKQEVETELGMTATHLRNQLRSLNWLMKELFGSSDHWPINYKRWGGVYFYRLDPTTAQWWREAE
jgi:hypothetical protein